MDLSSLQFSSGNLLEGLAALIVVFWLMSAGTSFVVEGFSSFFNIRGNALRLFIVEILQGELQKTRSLGRFVTQGFWGFLSGRVKLSEPKILDFSRSFFGNPLIKSQEQPKFFRQSSNVAPSYLPATIFSTSVIDQILSFQSWNSVAQGLGFDQKARHKFITFLDNVCQEIASLKLPNNATAYDAAVAALIKYLSDRGNADAIKHLSAILDNVPNVPATVTGLFNPASTPATRADSFAQAHLGGPSGPLGQISARFPRTIAGITEALQREGIPSALRQALLPLLEAAQNDIDDFTARVEHWYDTTMQRASGWYNRYTKMWLFGIGLILAVLYNVDSIRIAGALMKDSALRQSGYAAAVDIVGKSEVEANALPQQLAFVKAVEDVCDDGSPPKEDDGSPPKEDDGSPPKESGAQDKEIWTCQLKPESIDHGDLVQRLAPLTLRSGEDNTVLLYALIHRDSDGNFVESVKTFCAANSKNCSVGLKCVLDVKDETITEKTCPGKPDSDIVKKAEAIYNDSKFFWYPGLAKDIIYSKAELKKNLEDKLTAARGATMASIGAVDAYTSKLPGVGPISEIARGEHWQLCSLATLWRVVGWLITALMVSFGSAFWFDLLNKVVNRRATGEKPATAVANAD